VRAVSRLVISMAGLLASCSTISGSTVDLTRLNNLELLSRVHFTMEDEAHYLICTGSNPNTVTARTWRKYGPRLDPIKNRLIALHGEDEVLRHTIVGLARVQKCEETVRSERRVAAMLKELERRLEIL
jgi:hypothetical protein